MSRNTEGKLKTRKDKMPEEFFILTYAVTGIRDLCRKTEDGFEIMARHSPRNTTWHIIKKHVVMDEVVERGVA